MPSDDEPGCGKIRVLVVDDHHGFRRGLIGLLTQTCGFDVVGEAADGEAAIEAAARTAPQVVLMDVAMPRMNGPDATRQIVAASPGVKVLGLSAFASRQTDEHMRDAGAARCLTKEISAQELCRQVRQLLAAAPADAAPPSGAPPAA